MKGEGRDARAVPPTAGNICEPGSSWMLSCGWEMQAQLCELAAEPVARLI